jgi:hypothetical protein
MLPVTGCRLPGKQLEKWVTAGFSGYLFTIHRWPFTPLPATHASAYPSLYLRIFVILHLSANKFPI